MTRYNRLLKGCENVLETVDRVFLTDFALRCRNRRLGMHSNSYVFRVDQLCFVHLPKTGGTSLNELLRHKGSDLFTGMFNHQPVSKKCPPGDFGYFTVMRNPVDRVWSYYQMCLRSLARGGGLYGHMAERGLEFFLRHCWEARNMACRYYTGQIWSEPKEATLEKAWTNLGNFRRVLDFTVLAQDSSAWLAACGLPHEHVPVLNSHCYPQPDAPEIDLIERFNRFDIEIYRRWMSEKQSSMGNLRQ